MANQKAIAYLREGKPLCIRTAYGNVDLRSTSSVWGAGPNITGFRFAKDDAPCLSDRQGIYLFGVDWAGTKQMADEWAYWELQKDSLKEWGSREDQGE